MYSLPALLTLQIYIGFWSHAPDPLLVYLTLHTGSCKVHLERVEILADNRYGGKRESSIVTNSSFVLLIVRLSSTLFSELPQTDCWRLYRYGVLQSIRGRKCEVVQAPPPLNSTDLCRAP